MSQCECFRACECMRVILNDVAGPCCTPKANTFSPEVQIIKSPANTNFISPESRRSLRIFHGWRVIVFKALFTLHGPSNRASLWAVTQKALLARWAGGQIPVWFRAGVCLQCKKLYSIAHYLYIYPPAACIIIRVCFTVCFWAAAVAVGVIQFIS